jgi:hypothetical protein
MYPRGLMGIDNLFSITDFITSGLDCIFSQYFTDTEFFVIKHIHVHVVFWSEIYLIIHVLNRLNCTPQLKIC